MRVLLVLTCALSSACAAVHRPAATVASLTNETQAIGVSERATTDTVIERLARRVVKRGDKRLDILLLSGGGQMGAYGAGFLRGWQARTDSGIPQFDLVTGISTGALQSVFALLGTQPALDTLSAIYRRAGERIAPSIDWWFWLRKTGGLVNTSRFRRSIQETLNEQMQRNLRWAFAEGRQLVIASTDYDLGIGRTWDVARELDSTKAGRDRVVQLMLAASAIPGIFPPIIVDKHVHGDGGVIANLLPILALDDYKRLAERLRTLGVQDTVTVRIWGIMNNYTHAPIAVINPASRKTISSRGTNLLFYAHQPQQLADIATLAVAVSKSVPGLLVETRFSTLR